MTDISSRKRVQEALLELADGLANVQGEACFEALVRSFAAGSWRARGFRLRVHRPPGRAGAHARALEGR